MSITPSSYEPTPPTPMPPSIPSPKAVNSSRNPVVDRYADGYRVAKFQVGIGATIKIVSVVIGGLIVLLSLAEAFETQRQMGMLSRAGASLGFMFGLRIGAGGFSIGVIVSAQGQLTKATIDSAVNTSPFLNMDEKARMMSL